MSVINDEKQTAFAYRNGDGGPGAASYQNTDISTGKSERLSGNLDTPTGKAAVAKIAPFAKKCGINLGG